MPAKKKKGYALMAMIMTLKWRQQGCDSEVIVVLCPIKLGECLCMHASEKNAENKCF